MVSSACPTRCPGLFERHVLPLPPFPFPEREAAYRRLVADDAPWEPLFTGAERERVLDQRAWCRRIVWFNRYALRCQPACPVCGWCPQPDWRVYGRSTVRLRTFSMTCSRPRCALPPPSPLPPGAAPPWVRELVRGTRDTTPTKGVVHFVSGVPNALAVTAAHTLYVAVAGTLCLCAEDRNVPRAVVTAHTPRGVFPRVVVVLGPNGWPPDALDWPGIADVAEGRACYGPRRIRGDPPHAHRPPAPAFVSTRTRYSGRRLPSRPSGSRQPAWAELKLE